MDDRKRFSILEMDKADEEIRETNKKNATKEIDIEYIFFIGNIAMDGMHHFSKCFLFVKQDPYSHFQCHMNFIIIDTHLLYDLRLIISVS